MERPKVNSEWDIRAREVGGRGTDVNRPIER